MNYLGIDFGTKRIGLAYSQQGIIFTIPPLQNDQHLFDNLLTILKEYQINEIYIGISEGKIANLTQRFIDKLALMVKLPIESVEEAVSTLEAEDMFKKNLYSAKKHSRHIDSMAAAIILNRVIN